LSCCCAGRWRRSVECGKAPAAKPKIPARTALSTSTRRQRSLAQMGKPLGKLPGTQHRTMISPMAQGDHRVALVRGT